MVFCIADCFFAESLDDYGLGSIAFCSPFASSRLCVITRAFHPQRSVSDLLTALPGVILEILEPFTREFCARSLIK